MSIVPPASQGEELILLISQPRAGSTLVQRILAKHEQILTTDEPWMLLPIISTLMQDAPTTIYDGTLAQAAMCGMLDKLGISDVEAARAQALALYGLILSQSDARFFLDKTPRYYFLLPYLNDVFPQALKLILIRNPLAVLGSILETWVGEKWHHLPQYRYDLLTAPTLLAEAIQRADPNTLILRYERVIAQPESLGLVFEHLNLPILSDFSSYEHQDPAGRRFGDKNIDRYAGITQKRIDRWRDLVTDPQVWRLMSDYLDEIGVDHMTTLGYDYAEMRAFLDEQRPAAIWQAPTMPLTWLLSRDNSKINMKPRYIASRLSRFFWRRT